VCVIYMMHMVVLKLMGVYVCLKLMGVYEGNAVDNVSGTSVRGAYIHDI
jgi:hypothetical protein